MRHAGTDIRSELLVFEMLRPDPRPPISPHQMKMVERSERQRSDQADTENNNYEED